MKEGNVIYENAKGGFKKLTKDECIQTFVWHVLIHQHLFITFNTAANKSYKIAVLKLTNNHYFVHEFLQPLSRCSRKPFNCYFSTILQSPLQENIMWQQLYTMVLKYYNFVAFKAPCIRDQNHPVQVCLTGQSCLWQ